MNPGSAWRIVIGLLLVAAAVALGVGAYQAGLAQGLAQTGTAVAPGVVPYYGWHPFGFGFGFFGFLGTLLFILLIFALIRALVFRGGPRGGWYGPGGGWRGGHWESRGQEMFDEWHRRSHERGPDHPEGTPPPGSTPPPSA
jgi:hypothetical protein